MTDVSKAASLMGRKSAEARTSSGARRNSSAGCRNGASSAADRRAVARRQRREANVSIYKRGEVYWYKFMWKGKLVRESTKQGNDKVARQMEAAHRTLWQRVRSASARRSAVPTLAAFLDESDRALGKSTHARGFGIAPECGLCSAIKHIVQSSARSDSRRASWQTLLLTGYRRVFKLARSTARCECFVECSALPLSGACSRRAPKIRTSEGRASARASCDSRRGIPLSGCSFPTSCLRLPRS